MFGKFLGTVNRHNTTLSGDDVTGYLLILTISLFGKINLFIVWGIETGKMPVPQIDNKVDIMEY
jgi:hypothetical protein